MDYRSDVVQTQINSLEAASSAISDTNLAEESSFFASSNLISQISVAVLAQSNQMKSNSMMALLRKG
jgi:flagellin-like hook-associated protein FlgL